MSGAAINLDILPNSSKSASKVNKEFSKEDMAGKILLHFKIRTCKKEDNPCSKFFFFKKELHNHSKYDGTTDLAILGNWIKTLDKFFVVVKCSIGQ